MRQRKEIKTFSTVETLGLILQYKNIISEIIRKMDLYGHGFMLEIDMHRIVHQYTADFKRDIKRKVRIAFSLHNLTQANIVVNVDNHEGDKRLFFHESVLGVVRLCDVALTQQLTDAQLKTQLAMLASIETQFSLGGLTFLDNDLDFQEAIENLLVQLGNLFSLVRQNILKMEHISSDLETLTSRSVGTQLSPEEFVEAKEKWLDHIINLYDRHILPTLTFLNPESTYEHGAGLHQILESILRTLINYDKNAIARNIEQYALSFLNMYKPIESVATTVNRFIHKERDSIRRFNAYEHFYQQVLMKELALTKGNNLNRTQLSAEAILLENYMVGLKKSTKPQGYLFDYSDAYYVNLFNELEARTKDIFAILNVQKAFGKAKNDNSAKQRLKRAKTLKVLIENMTLRETDDLTAIFHQRLTDQLPNYELHDLISAIRFAKMSTKDPNLHIKTTNIFAMIESDTRQYRYRKVKCFRENSIVGN